MTAGTHVIRRCATDAGYSARCCCGWSTVRRSRQLRDQDADAHAMTALDDAHEMNHAAERVSQ